MGEGKVDTATLQIIRIIMEAMKILTTAKMMAYTKRKRRRRERAGSTTLEDSWLSRRSTFGPPRASRSGRGGPVEQKRGCGPWDSGQSKGQCRRQEESRWVQPA